MQYVLLDTGLWHALRPLTDTRPCAFLRVGIDTLLEKWARHLGRHPAIHSYGHLAGYSTWQPGAESLFICGALAPDVELLRTLHELGPGEGLQDTQGRLLAYRHTAAPVACSDEPPGDVRMSTYAPRFLLQAPWDIFRLNRAVLLQDFEEKVAGRKSQPVTDAHTVVYGKDNLFLEEGVRIRAAIIDAESGPVYLARDAEVQPGAVIQGAHAIGAHSVVNMGAKLRGDSTLGPYCKVGGELSNSVILGYSNKGHDGFVGNSVLGQWCNLGADTNTSNLKNNYGTVQVHSYAAGEAVDTGLLFCGLIMGDHAKSGINTMFNTGTVVGVCANVFGADFPPKHIPAFSWGGAGGLAPYRLDKALETARRVMARRGLQLTELEQRVLQALGKEH
ncbi:MAG: GlmU family protein [Bacteroidetes bacterium]|nr:GlmU family protein [Bacteroidota bacterium]